jgi:hypothetical protein
MAFVDGTSGRLIDAVLTKEGRKAMAEGRFQITQFGFADDEMNYDLSVPTATEGYKFLTLDQTPILEANASGEGSCKYLLYSTGRRDLLYAPVIKAFEGEPYAMFEGGTTGVKRYVISCDQETWDSINSGRETAVAGVQDGKNFQVNFAIRVDEGQDTKQLPSTQPLEASLKESQYLVRIDNRLGTIVSSDGQTPTNLGKNYVSQDNIALYTANLDGTGLFVKELLPSVTSTGTSIDGPRGTLLKFRIGATDNLSTTPAFFNRWGSPTRDAIGSAAIGSLKQISSTITIEGFQTGYRIVLPVDFVKLV